MCFVAGWLKTGSEPGLTVATNRDEFYDRQGDKPLLHRSGTYDVLSPRDPRKEGTWIGLNEKGLFVALTNKLDTNELEDAPSRGRLVRSLLEESPDRESALEEYDELDPSRFNPFHLLIIDREGLTYVHHEMEGDERMNPSEGVFLLTNESGFRSDTDALRSALPEVDDGAPSAVLDGLEAFCGSHDPLMERESHCLHAGIAGTLSSSILTLGSHEKPVYRFAQGPPCKTDYVSVDISEAFAENVREAWDPQPSPLANS